MLKIRIIAAIDENNGLGKDNKLLIHIPNDLRRFKELTTGGVVIMGRKTFESLPGQKPLPNRINIVLTRGDNFYIDGCETAHSIDDVFKILNYIKSSHDVWSHKDEMNVYVIGGAEIYRQFLPHADELVITKIKNYHIVFTGDTSLVIMKLKNCGAAPMKKDRSRKYKNNDRYN